MNVIEAIDKELVRLHKEMIQNAGINEAYRDMRDEIKRLNSLLIKHAEASLATRGAKETKP